MDAKGNSICPRRPKSITEYQRIFSAPVIFRCASNALVMELEFLDHTIRRGSSLIWILSRYLDDVINKIPRKTALLHDPKSDRRITQRWDAEARRRGEITCGQPAHFAATIG